MFLSISITLTSSDDISSRQEVLKIDWDTVRAQSEQLLSKRWLFPGTVLCGWPECPQCLQ